MQLSELINPPPELSPETFSDLFEHCRPRPREEQWMDVMWIPALWEARQAAASKQKPLFLWAMNGHPLGCV